MTLDVNEIVREALWHLDAEFETEDHDQPPRLLMVLPTPVKDVGGVIEVKPLFGWEECAPLARSAQSALGAMVHAYASMPKDLLRSGVPANLFALAFVSEAWMLTAPKDDEAGIEAARKAGREHTINAHPHRVEVRMTYLQPVAGEPATLMHERDGVVELLDGRAGGEIPRLLAELVAALTR